ncbi:transposase [Curvibacter gracilis]|uniref:transposase n=1 Tax=Curvibacter gracilis TaxID=230310 RepID=UPI0009FEC98E|nr:transposase [Curvibacter gracilis]
MAHCAQSGIECLQWFAKRLRKYWSVILARLRWPMHTSQLEGINKRTKVIKRTAQGNRGVECFPLEIKAALPGNA